MIDSRRLQKTDTCIFPADQFPWTFHRFGDLPKEIRLYIWRLAWLTRMVRPYENLPALQIQCRSRQRCRACRCTCWLPPVRAPAVMQACREARLETQRISKPLPTWMRESLLLDALRPSWSTAQALEAAGNHNIKAPLPIITHFNTESDVVDLDGNSLIAFSQTSGPPNHDDVFQVALDPEVPILLNACLFDRWVDPVSGFSLMSNGLEALYHRYLKPRKHVYVQVAGMSAFVLTEEGWQKAIREGLFSGHYLETKLIPVNDVCRIRKYEALRHYCIPHTTKPETPNWDRQLWTADPNQWQSRRLVKSCDLPDAVYNRWVSNRLTASREDLSSAQLFMLQIADFLMWRRGAGVDRGEDIMDLDGQFKRDHPLVQQEDLRMPSYTAVSVFQAVPAPKNDQMGLYNRLAQLRPKYPEEDSSRLRLSTRHHLNAFLGRWGRSL